MHESKTSVYLFDSLNLVFNYWNIQNKIFSITTDSGSNIFGCINKLDESVLKNVLLSGLIYVLMIF